MESDFERILFKDPEKSIRDYISIHETHQGKYIDVDIVREMCPAYSRNRDSRRIHSSSTHEPSSKFADMIIDHFVTSRTPPQRVAMIGGGPGSGKSSASIFFLERGTDMVIDKTFSKLEKVLNLLEKIGRTTSDLHFCYVHKPVQIAAAHAFRRALTTGRIVPVGVLATAHWGAQQAILSLCSGEHIGADLYIVDHSPPSSQPYTVKLDRLEGRHLSRLQECRYSSLSQVEALANEGLSSQFNLERKYAEVKKDLSWIDRVYESFCGAGAT